MRANKPITEQEALLKMGALCSGAEYCIYDITQKLTKMNVARDAQERIIARLEKDGYIDELRYSLAYTRDKLRYNGWGRNKISMMLATKRIDRNIINEAIAEIDDKEYFDILKHLINTKRKSVKADSDYERNAKLIRFAVGRGFEIALASKCLNISEDYDIEI